MKLDKIFISFFVFYLVLLCVSCTTVAPLSAHQRRAIQVKHFNTSYNHVFRAFKTVLQDEGYIIKNQDMKGGLIVAHHSKPSGNRGFMILANALSDRQQNYVTGTRFEISVNLEAIRKNYIESRLIIQQVNSYNMGGSQGTEIINPNLYRNIYSKVRVEVARRKAQGK